MARAADPEIVKFKRRVVKLKSDLDNIASKLMMFIGYPYEPSQWDKISQDFDEEMVAIHEVTESRYDAACNIANFKEKKRQLRSLAANNHLSHSQVNAYQEIKDKVSNAISVMSALPDLGTSFLDWNALPDEFKKQGVGHPKVTLEEAYVTLRSELSLAHKLVNDNEEGGKSSTIEDILAEEDVLVMNSGRKKLPVKVAEIEELERKKRTILSQIEDINNEFGEEEFKVGRGKRKLSKEVRIEKKTETLVEITDQIVEMESNLSPVDYGLRCKRVLEREKRYAKEDGNNNVFNEISEKIVAIDNVLLKVSNKGGRKDTAKNMINKIMNSVDITIDSAVQDIINDVNNGVSDNAAPVQKAALEEPTPKSNKKIESEADILDIFNNMDLPQF